MKSEVWSDSQADLFRDAIDRQPRALQVFADGADPRPEEVAGPGCKAMFDINTRVHQPRSDLWR
jgi:hypothetical protein